MIWLAVIILLVGALAWWVSRLRVGTHDDPRLAAKDRGEAEAQRYRDVY